MIKRVGGTHKKELVFTAHQYHLISCYIVNILLLTGDTWINSKKELIQEKKDYSMLTLTKKEKKTYSLGEEDNAIYDYLTWFYES